MTAMIHCAPPCARQHEDRDIRIDFYQTPYKNPVVWGTVYDDCRQPLSGILVKLLHCNDEKNSCCLVVGQTYSDCSGHYEIPIPPSCQGNFRIEVGSPGAIRAPILSADHTNENLPYPSAEHWNGYLPRRGQNNICYY